MIPAPNLDVDGLVKCTDALGRVIFPVAAMYNHVHPEYIAEGLDLLVELSLFSASELRIIRQRSLANYRRTLATELVDYIAKVELRFVGWECG